MLPYQRSSTQFLFLLQPLQQLIATALQQARHISTSPFLALVHFAGASCPAGWLTHTSCPMLQAVPVAHIMFIARQKAKVQNPPVASSSTLVPYGCTAHHKHACAHVRMRARCTCMHAHAHECAQLPVQAAWACKWTCPLRASSSLRWSAGCKRVRVRTGRTSRPGTARCGVA